MTAPSTEPITAGDPPTTQPTNPPDPPQSDPLGDAGKKALQEERAARKAAEKALAEREAKLKEFEDRDKTEAEKLAAKAEAAEKRAAAADARAVKAEVRALADAFADRDDAALNLGDLSKFVKDGDVDTDAITRALDEVLKRKPHLAKNAGPRTPAPDPTQGARGPVDIDAQIREAESKGDVRAAIRLKNQKFLAAQNGK